MNEWISKKIYEGQHISGAAMVGIKVAQLKVLIVRFQARAKEYCGC